MALEKALNPSDGTLYYAEVGKPVNMFATMTGSGGLKAD
jgi:hypothetical protein